MNYVCGPCDQGRHGDCEVTVYTGHTVTDWSGDRAQNRPEFVACGCDCREPR